ncbi:PIG-L family deacetylase [Pontibacter sp. JH31]|uniref:PIG-L family deacetylase n=1 Tax=Pontibacter aquaedesilientis TaxID=2766980 RepID=A0ABR7XKF5_9BACT|nr:PIG-L family deacetylase [Pontibacter aquaedesilientis]MBD1398755.1 PIG-L family deacetylase [Pontibacter aquaedesilientis]
MRILYIFPHPDDESFGPVPVMWQQLEQGHQVYLLTLTRGGATKVRHEMGLSVEEMGEIRYKEMLAVERTLGLSGMTVLDLPDNGLAEMDPREIEKVVRAHIRQIEPQLIVSYPVHGVSGFHDHLVMHAVIKRLYLEMRDGGADYLKRLAFLTLPNKTEQPLQHGTFIMKHSAPSLIDCEVQLRGEDIEMMKKALSCYKTYQDVIKQAGVVESIGDKVYFEIYGEDHKPPLANLTDEL